MRNIIIYHGKTSTVDCPDGIVSAAIAGMKFPDPLYKRDTYRDINDYPDVPEPDKYPFRSGDRLIIVDYSFPIRWLQHWQKAGAIVMVIEHHEKKFEMLEGFRGAVLDASECGATLTWKTLFPNQEMPDWLEDVKRRDIGTDGYYDGKCPESEAFNEGLGRIRHLLKNTGESVAVAQFLIQLLKGDIKPKDIMAIADTALEEQDNTYMALMELGRKEVERRDAIVDRAFRRAQLVKLGPFECGYVETRPDEDRVVSQLGHKLSLMEGARFGWVKTSRGKSELRGGDGTLHLGDIAEAHGGGGHPKAAGFNRAVEPEYLPNILPVGG